MKVKYTLYFNSEKSDMEYQFLELCEHHGFTPSDEAIKNSAYVGYEIGVDVEWDLETGNCKILGISKT
jgi:hypothetical protein